MVSPTIPDRRLDRQYSSDVIYRVSHSIQRGVRGIEDHELIGTFSPSEFFTAYPTLYDVFSRMQIAGALPDALDIRFGNLIVSVSVG